MMTNRSTRGDELEVHRRLRLLIWISGSNGISIAVFAGVLTLASLPLDPGWSGLLAGVLITAFGVFEILGWRHLMKGQVETGIAWARRSQVGIFLTVVIYSVYQLHTASADSLTALLSPEIRQFLIDLYQIDDWMLGELLLLASRLVYLVLILTSAIYQGGLWWFYGRSMYHLEEISTRVK